MEELWKNIPGFKGHYKASTLGEIKSFKHFVPKILVPQPNGKGYNTVTLFKDNKRHHMAVHSVIAMTFLGHVPNGLSDIVVHHVDENKLNNRVDNLRLWTQRDNCAKDKSVTTSKHKGVHWDKVKRRWVVSLFYNKKLTYLGAFDNEDDAGNEYKRALNEFFTTGVVTRPHVIKRRNP